MQSAVKNIRPERFVGVLFNWGGVQVEGDEQLIRW